MTQAKTLSLFRPPLQTLAPCRLPQLCESAFERFLLGASLDLLTSSEARGAEAGRLWEAGRAVRVPELFLVPLGLCDLRASCPLSGPLQWRNEDVDWLN